VKSEHSADRDGGFPRRIEVTGKKRLFKMVGRLYSIRRVHRRWSRRTSHGAIRWRWQIYTEGETAVIAREEERWYSERWV